MNKIKFLKYNKILLNGVLYNPYNVGELPQRFGFIYNEDKDQYGISRFFDFKGLTYIKDKD
mgnify:FL=1|jgi:hypothetical protein